MSAVPVPLLFMLLFGYYNNVKFKNHLQINPGQSQNTKNYF